MLPVIRGHLRNSLLLTCGVLLAALVWYLVGLDSGSPPSDRDGGVPLEALDEVAEQAELGPGSALEAAAEQRAPARTEIESAPAAPVRPDRRVSISGRTIDDGGVALGGRRGGHLSIPRLAPKVQRKAARYTATNESTGRPLFSPRRNLLDPGQVHLCASTPVTTEPEGGQATGHSCP